MEAAKDLLKRAVDLDSAQKFSEALICYEEGIQNLLRAMGECKLEAERKEMKKKAEEYLARAERLKKIKDLEALEKDARQNPEWKVRYESIRYSSFCHFKGPTESVQYIHIKEGETGYSYARVFQSCLDGNVEWAEVQDPYIRSKHQVHNFVRFCELMLKNCKRLRHIQLNTGFGDAHEVSSLKELQESLRDHRVNLEVSYSSTLHDREVRFSNGWIVKMGRGLDYFQKPKGQFTIGNNDFDLRPCHETTIEIFHRLNTKKVKSTQK